MNDEDIIKWLNHSEIFDSGQIATIYAGFLPNSQENPIPKYPGDNFFEIYYLIGIEAETGIFKPHSIIDNREYKTDKPDLRDDQVCIMYTRDQIEKWFKGKGLVCPKLLLPNNDSKLKAIFDNYNNNLKTYQEKLDKDLPKPEELTSYIQALEQYCAGKEGTKTRQETYSAVIYANKKRYGRPPLSDQEMQNKLDEVEKIKNENPKLNYDQACQKAGISAKTRRDYKNKLK